MVPVYRMFLLLFTILLYSLGYAQMIEFTNMSQQLGINYSYNTPSDFGGGISFCDFTGDGLDDLSFGSATGTPIYVYKNTETSFSPFLSLDLVQESEASRSLVWVDYDNDGDKDLTVINEYGYTKLYRNDGTTNFVDVTLSAGFTDEQIYSYSGCWGDYDRDGWLDFYVVSRHQVTPSMSANKLYRNLGDGTFEDVTAQTNTADEQGLGFAAVFFDYDNDGWSDIYIANDKSYTHNTLLKNKGDGTFEDISITGNTGMNMDGMGIAVGDYDNNGYLDIYVTNTPASSLDFGGNLFLHNNGDGTFTEKGSELGLRVFNVGWGANFVDLDNDTDLDLFVANGAMFGSVNGFNSLFINQGDGTFLEDTLSALTNVTGLSFGSSIGDINGDGYYDVGVMNGNGLNLSLWVNEGGQNNWLKVTLEGLISNRDGIGSWIEAYLDGQRISRYTHCGISYASQHSNTEIIGMGSHTQIDSLLIRWPSGLVNKLEQVDANQTLHIVEDTASVVVNSSEVIATPDSWMVSPNPTADHFRLNTTVSTPGPISVRVSTISGRQLHLFEFPNSEALEQHLFPNPTDHSGVFLIQIIYQNQIVTKKMVKG